MEEISPMEGVIEGENAYVTQSTGHGATINPNVFECYRADYTCSTSHSACRNANGCSNAEFVLSGGHSAFSYTNTNECEYADFVASAGHSAFSNMETDPIADFVASIKSFEISGKRTEFQADISGEGWNTTPERYLENLYLLGKAWVRKVQHVARLTLNTPAGPVWPREIEPLALEFFDFLREHVHWTYLPEREGFADEIDLVWRENPAWLPQEHTRFIPLWEYVTGMARTWGWNWHNEVRKQGAPEEVWRKEERHPRSRFYLNHRSAARHHHVLAAQNVPSISQWIRTNKFYQVGDDITSCERPESSPRCRFRCHHTEYAQTLKRLKRKHGLIRAPGVEPESEHGGIE